MHKSMESPAPQYPENVGDFFHFRLFFLSWYAGFQLHSGASIREPGQKAGLRRGFTFDPMLNRHAAQRSLGEQTFSWFFQLLTWTTQEKSVDTTGKSALILVRLSTLKVIHFMQAKIVKIYRRLYGGGQVCAPHPYKHLQNFTTEELYLCQFSTNHILSR